MSRKRKSQTVTIRMNRDGTYTFRSTGGYDLRKLFPELRKPADATEDKPSDAILSLLDDASKSNGGDA